MSRPQPTQAHLRLIVTRETHRKAKSIAGARGMSLSELVSELVQQLPNSIDFEEELQHTT